MLGLRPAHTEPGFWVSELPDGRHGEVVGPGFLLVAGTERAEEVLERSRRIAVSGEAFDRFVAALDADVEPMPTLKRYAEEPSSIPAG